MGDVEVHDQLVAWPQIGFVARRRTDPRRGSWSPTCAAQPARSTSTRSTSPVIGSVHSSHLVSVRRPNSCGTRYGGRSGLPAPHSEHCARRCDPDSSRVDRGRTNADRGTDRGARSEHRHGVDRRAARERERGAGTSRRDRHRQHCAVAPVIDRVGRPAYPADRLPSTDAGPGRRRPVAPTSAGISLNPSLSVGARHSANSTGNTSRSSIATPMPSTARASSAQPAGRRARSSTWSHATRWSFGANQLSCRECHRTVSCTSSSPAGSVARQRHRRPTCVGRDLRHAQPAVL